MAEITVNFQKQIIILRFLDFDTDIDVDELTKIDYSNLFGEMVTSATLVNRVGILRAEFQNRLSEEKVNLDIYEANLRKTFRSNKTIDGKKATVQEADDAILSDPIWQGRKKKLINIERDFNYIDALYWAVQSKDKKLSAITKQVTPTEFEQGIIEGVVNGIMVKKKKKGF